MKLYARPCGPIQTNAYLLADPERGQAVLIDAPQGVWAQIAPLLEQERCQLSDIWLTHAHWDHIQGVEELLRHAPAARLWAHRADKPLHDNPSVMDSYALGPLGLAPLRIDFYAEHGERQKLLGLDCEVRHVPGHCPGSLLLHLPAANAAFVGDAIFRGSVGRTDLPGGDFGELARSIREQVYTLPSTTHLYPGHGPETDVATERAHNPYVHD